MTTFSSHPTGLPHTPSLFSILYFPFSISDFLNIFTFIHEKTTIDRAFFVFFAFFVANLCRARPVQTLKLDEGFFPIRSKSCKTLPKSFKTRTNSHQTHSKSHQKSRKNLVFSSITAFCPQLLTFELRAINFPKSHENIICIPVFMSRPRATLDADPIHPISSSFSIAGPRAETVEAWHPRANRKDLPPQRPVPRLLPRLVSMQPQKIRQP